jgi:cell division protein FtsL
MLLCKYLLKYIYGGVVMQNRRKYRVKWFRLLVIVLSCYSIYLYVAQQSDLNAIHSESESVRTQLSQLQQVNVALHEERKALNDYKYVEKLAREELGLVKIGETPYIVSDKK